MKVHQLMFIRVIPKRREIMKQLQPFLIILVLTLSGCAASSGDVADEFRGAAERVCVNVRNIDSFDAIDDQHIYVRARGRQEHFLFTMGPGCFGLRSAHTIAVTDTLSTICSNTFGEVTYRGMGRGLESCLIRNVEAVASKDDAKGLVEDRKAARREKQSDSK